DVTNTGSVAGREVVQSYVSVPGSAVDRAPRELKAFASVELQPGETAQVSLLARERDLRDWGERVDPGSLEGGDDGVGGGAASRGRQPGETAQVSLLARERDLRYWEERVDQWILEGGDYVVEVGSSSRELHTSATVAVRGDELVIPLTNDSSVGDALAHPIAG